MKPGIPAGNVLVAIFYIAISATLYYVLKLAVKPVPKLNKKPQRSQEKQNQAIDYSKFLLASWFKKYSLVGSFLNSDKKYLLKEFTILSIYGIACLHINHIILWPAALVLVNLPIIYIANEYIVKKFHQIKVEDYKANKDKGKVKNQIESELQIESVNVESVQHKKSSVQVESKIQRSNLEIILISSLSFLALILFAQTLMTFFNSISNSGQLNLESILLIFMIDQLGVRPFTGFSIIGGLILLQKYSLIKMQQNSFVASLCEEQIRDWMIEQEKQRLKLLIEGSASPTRVKADSVNQGPNIVLSEHKNDLIDILQMQATKRQKKESEQIDAIYLTTAEKDIFSQENIQQNRSGVQTRRRRAKQNDKTCISAQTINIGDEKRGFEDIVILKNDPLGQFELNKDNTYGMLTINMSPSNQTKRKGINYKRRNKRQLNLTGSSPYLQYLPDMLKKVDKQKNATKDRKIL